MLYVYLVVLSCNMFFQSKIEWDLTNGPRSVSCYRAIRYSGFFGVREKWVLLEIEKWIHSMVGFGSRKRW